MTQKSEPVCNARERRRSRRLPTAFYHTRRIAPDILGSLPAQHPLVQPLLNWRISTGDNLAGTERHRRYRAATVNCLHGRHPAIAKSYNTHNRVSASCSYPLFKGFKPHFAFCVPFGGRRNGDFCRKDVKIANISTSA